MWGNAQGWFIALVLLGSLIYGMGKLNGLGEISKPTGFGTDPQNLGEVKLPTSPATLVAMDQPLDAKPLYRAAIDDYLLNQDRYDRLLSSKESFDADAIPALKDLLDATHADRALVFNDDPGEIVTYKEKPGLDALTALGHLAARAALLDQPDHPDDARKLFEAEFALGAKLYDERLTVEEFNRGLELLAEASTGLARTLGKAGDSAGAGRFRAFDQSRLQYYNARVLPMLKVLDSIDANIVGAHAGDIFYFAGHCAERMYRVEAIFAMGRMRFFAGTSGTVGNQRGATIELKKLANDPDPVIRRAAAEARDLTFEQYRVLR